MQFTVIISLVVCGQTREVNEIMRQTLIHGALNLERLGRHGTFNLLKPNNTYICRTAALNSRRYILNIYSTNIHTEYFKHAA